jgi:hypothetical protein
LNEIRPEMESKNQKTRRAIGKSADRKEIEGT